MAIQENGYFVDQRLLSYRSLEFFKVSQGYAKTRRKKKINIHNICRLPQSAIMPVFIRNNAVTKIITSPVRRESGNKIIKIYEATKQSRAMSECSNSVSGNDRLTTEMILLGAILRATSNPLMIRRPSSGSIPRFHPPFCFSRKSRMISGKWFHRIQNPIEFHRLRRLL